MKETSQTISDFLAFLAQCRENYNIACASQADADALTQDLLHTLELDQHSYHETARIGKQLAQTRQLRRTAKDKVEILTPIVGYLSTNRPAIEALQRLLGDVRKIEKRHQNRIYVPKAGQGNDNG